jgi:sulfur carrier protein ThiS adenylyltransferase
MSGCATGWDLSDRDLRQRQIVPPQKLAVVHALVIGVGAVGRQTALQLAATGVPEMTLVDHDVVDVVNLAPQGYTPEDLGKAKVQATGAWCGKLNPQLVLYPLAERFARSSPRRLACCRADAPRRLVVFCCVDSISTRGLIWQALHGRCALFVDARMAAEVVRVLATDQPETDSHYPSTLFAEQEAYSGTCTARSTLYAASIAAGLMLAQLTRWLRGLTLERDLLLNLLSSELAVG